jgi:phosphoribosyl 1,2-cyclic phosphodiesterase
MAGNLGETTVTRGLGGAGEGYRHATATSGGPLLNVSFFGVRGSTPSPCDANRRYGGNTSCVALESPGHTPVVLDLGTGLRFWGETLDPAVPFRGAALVTHIHWDHVQGLPFFPPALRPGSCFDVYGPPQEDAGGLAAAFDEFMRPPYFPVTTKDLLGDIHFHDTWDCDLEIDGAKVKVRPVPHVGLTNGYRVEMGGATVAYISDHQMPLDGSHAVSDAVLELCDGADLLIHDAQYTVDEFPAKATWGHCTVDYAVHVAEEAGAHRLALFHHDPTHGDDDVDTMLEHARALASTTGLSEVVAAYEGLIVAYP